MGGKSYYCDYCDCFMKDDINIRKSHNIGLTHKIAKANYLEKFKSPQEIVAENAKKIPCKRFLNNKECQFGFYCNFGHYSSEELAYLEWIVDKAKHPNERAAINRGKTGENIPWKYPNGRKHLHQLPPSLQPIDFNNITESCFNAQWG